MIVQEHLEINGTDFIHTWSDNNRYVVRDNIEYDEAFDPASLNRTYAEGNPISDEIMIVDKAEAYDILTGVKS